MTGLMGVKSVRVPQTLALEAHAHLARVGERGVEGMALWAGMRQGESFCVTQIRIPAQEGFLFEDGVCVAVGAEELHRTNVWLFEEGLTLVVQLHSHPTDAYHSNVDDAFPIVTLLGGLSLVVPFFASRPFSVANCAVYRLIQDEGWVELSTAEARELIVVEG